MAEETKTKTSSRSKVEKPIVPVVETVIVAEETTETAQASEIQEVIAEPEPVVESSADVEVEAMGRRGRRSKSELEAQYRHEFEVALSNEPQFEVQLRDKLREKLSKLK